MRPDTNENPLTARGVERCDVLGVGISAINIPMALDTVRRWIETGQRHYVTVTGVHGVIESQRDPELKRIHNDAGLVTPDGVPMVWMNRLRGFGHVSRVYGPDLMLEVCRASEEETGYKHFLYGGGDDVAELLAAKLRERFPKLQIVGTYTPPFRALTEEEDREVVETINRSGADVVWVGLSTPKQEYWMARHVGRVNAPAMIGVGAAFDFHAGLKSQAPRWMQRSGLEWFYRLMCEPRRLWKRYLVNNPLFVWYVMLQWLRLKDFAQDPGPAALDANA